MTGKGPMNPNEYEAAINALLDGELDQEASEALKEGARDDAALAQAIIQAWQLQRSMEQLEVEKAPPSLRRKLRRIPRERGRGWSQLVWGLPRWAVAAAVVSVAVLALAVTLGRPDHGPAPAPVEKQLSSNPAPGLEPARAEEARAEEARRELEIAFYYLDKAGLRVGREINEVLYEEISEPVKDNLTKHIPYTAQSRKEKHA